MADERLAVRVEAERQIRALFATRDRLLPDADDPAVLSELTVVERQIRLALAVVRDGGEVGS